MSLDLTPKELVRRSVTMARANRRTARLLPQHATKCRAAAEHQMRLARELKRVSQNFRSYY